jgi:hypothetical protein
MPCSWHFVIEKMNHLGMMCISSNTHNVTKRFIAMKHSRKSVKRKAHAVPNIRFEQQQLTSFAGLVLLQPFLAAIDFAASGTSAPARSMGGPPSFSN